MARPRPKRERDPPALPFSSESSVVMHDKRQCQAHRSRGPVEVGGQGQQSSPSPLRPSECGGRWESEPPLGLQEVTGQVQDLDLTGPTMVWSEGWPSWVLAIQGAGAKDITFWIECGRPSMSLALQRLGLSQGRCWTWTAAIPKAQHASRLLIQGTHQFVVDKMQVALECGIPSARILAVEDISLEGLVDDPTYTHAHIVSHRQVGGVTDGRWAVFAPTLERPDLINMRLNLRRNLGDVLCSTVRGRASSPPHVLKQHHARQSREFKLPSDLIPVHRLEVDVVAPSVFSQTKFVSRSLTSGELWDAYDLSVSTQANLPIQSARDRPVDPSFLFAAPLKVLHHVLQAWLPTSSTAQVSTTPIPEGSLSFGPGDLPLHPDFLKVSHPLGEDSQPDILAVKHDDAQADANLWNIRAMGAFRPAAGSVTPMICGRQLCEDSVTLLEGLRQLAFRRFQLNLRRSFQRYLDATYGKGVLDPDSDFRRWQKNHRSSAFRLAGKKRKRMNPSSMVPASHQRWQELQKDLDVGLDAIRRGVGSSWWEWTLGSTLFFWRWPPEYRKQVRDGVSVFIFNERKLPKYRKRQQWPSDEEQAKKVEAKITKVRDNRGYLEPGFVESLTGFFAVPKGSDDIRMVYDATKCGLNAALWAPNFALPTVDSVVNNSDSFTWYGDIDLGEMFLNYPLDPRIRPYAGVETYRPSRMEKRENLKRIFHRWNRCAMGMMCSPYNATQSFSVSAEVITGDTKDTSSPLGWDRVVLNMPGTQGYNPCMPWCYRWNSSRGELPGFFATYVDDIRTGGQSEDQCYEVSRRVASRANYLGQQDAPRKRRKPSKHPGAWCGAIVVNRGEEGLYVTCSQEKWNKGRAHVESLLGELEGGAEDLDRKDLERKRGFLIHLARTFTYMNPYLKGFHLTMESFRPGRDEMGWKLSKRGWADVLSGEMGHEIKKEELHQAIKDHKDAHTPRDPPKRVKAVPRMLGDLRALWLLFQLKHPPLRLVRGRCISEALYGFGDASGKGFGASWEEGEKIFYRLGVWGRDGDGTSSNYRELANLVHTLEKMGGQGHLKGREIFLFTDNSTAEKAFYNGTSSSQILFSLVLEARLIEAKYGCIIRLIHVSGKRMIAQGTDGLSRGNFNEGVMQGKSMLSFVPLAQSAVSRSPNLKNWTESWLSVLGRPVEWLTPEDWFVRAHGIKGEQRNVDGMWMPRYQKGVFVWTPPPCVASFAVEQLRSARHKRTDSLHVFMCPETMRTTWEKDLRKVADLIIDIPPKEQFWNSDMYEKLTLALILPFRHRYPWQYRGTTRMVELARNLRSVWQGNGGSSGLILREFLCTERIMETM